MEALFNSLGPGVRKPTRANLSVSDWTIAAFCSFFFWSGKESHLKAHDLNEGPMLALTPEVLPEGPARSEGGGWSRILESP